MPEYIVLHNKAFPQVKLVNYSLTELGEGKYPTEVGFSFPHVRRDILNSNLLYASPSTKCESEDLRNTCQVHRPEA